MTSLEELDEQLRALDREEEGLHQRRAVVLRAYVQAAGGTNEAIKRLAMDKRTLVRLQRLDEVAMVVYRGPGVAYDDEGRPFGELGDDGGLEAQRTADSRWWRVASATRPKVKALVVVSAGDVVRIWQVRPGVGWEERDGKVALPLQGAPLDRAAADRLLPGLGLNVGDSRPMRRGLIREYLPLITQSADPTLPHPERPADGE